MCGVVGIVGRGPVNQSLYDALLVLQHRGQDAAGIVTCEANRLHLRKDNGLIVASEGVADIPKVASREVHFREANEVRLGFGNQWGFGATS